MNDQEKNIPPIIIIQTDSIFDNSINKTYSVRGDHHNIINQSRQVKHNNQNNSEIKNLQTENSFLKNENIFLKQQLEFAQNLLEVALRKD